MMNKIRFEIKDPSAPASSKQRRFYYLCVGTLAPVAITKGEVHRAIQAYSPEHIATVRKIYKSQKMASPYKRALCHELEVNPTTRLTNANAQAFLESAKRTQPERFARAKAALKGYTYKKKTQPGKQQ